MTIEGQVIFITVYHTDLLCAAAQTRKKKYITLQREGDDGTDFLHEMSKLYLQIHKVTLPFPLANYKVTYIKAEYRITLHSYQQFTMSFCFTDGLI